MAPGAPGSTASRPELVSPRRRHVKKDERLEREIDAACVRKECAYPATQHSLRR